LDTHTPQQQYTIGTGMMFSLCEMELAILRHKSKKANVYGYYQVHTCDVYCVP